MRKFRVYQDRFEVLINGIPVYGFRIKEHKIPVQERIGRPINCYFEITQAEYNGFFE